MTSKEFTIWLRGFTEGVHEFNITPKQWDLLKEKLAEVKDEPTYSIPFGVPNTAPIQTLPFIQPYDPYNPYKITSQPGTTLTVSSGSGGTIIATPGYGSITYANPPFGFGSTSTAYGYPSGSAWSYTNQSDGPYSTQDDNSLKPTKQTKFKKRKAKSVKEWEDNFDLGGGE